MRRLDIGVPLFAPDLCDAIFAATGKRVRRLSIGNQLAAGERS